MWLLSIFLSFSSPTWAQAPTPKDQVFSLNSPGNPMFSQCGLITRNAGNLIENISPACLQNVDNLYYDSDYSLDRRGGYAQYNMNTCSGQPIKGLWPFNGTDGIKYLVAFSSNSMYISSGVGNCNLINYDGAGTWNLDQAAEMECVQANGFLWCTDGVDTPFYLNQISSAPNMGAPIGFHIGTFRNRILMAGVPGSLTDIYLSGELNGTDWSIPPVQMSTSAAILSINGVNDGLKINCLMEDFQNQYYIGRDYDLWALSGYSLNDFTLREVSAEIGCIQPKSVQQVNNQEIWISKRGIESLSGTQITPVSYYIRPTIDQIIAATGNSRSQLINGNNFSSGNFCASGPQSCTSGTIFPGFVVPSSWSVVDNFQGFFSTPTFVTNLTTSAALGLQLTSNTYSDAWSNSIIAGDLGWKLTGGSYTITPIAGSQYLSSNCTGCSSDLQNVISTSSGIYNGGSWTFTHQFSAVGTNNCGGLNCFEFRIMKDASNDYYAAGWDNSSGVTHIAKLVFFNGTKTVLTSAPFNYAQSIPAIWNVIAANGVITLNINNVFIGSGTYSFGTSTKVEIAATGNNGVNTNNFSNFSFYNYNTPGLYQSTVFDTALSTPIAGPIVAGYSAPPGTTLAFATRSGTTITPNASWTPWSNVANWQVGGQPTNLTNEFYQYESSFTTSYATTTPNITYDMLSAETTGYYISPAILVSTPTSWGAFNVDAVLNGGSFTFYLSTGATQAIATDKNANWTQQLPNTQITVSTTTEYVAIRVLFNLTVATQTPTLTDMTVNWNNGLSAPPVSSMQFDDRYYLFYTTSTALGSVNDHAVVYDYNNKWTLLDDIHAYSATLYLNQPFIGDSNSTGFIYQMESGQSDNGSPFTYSWTTGDIDMGAAAERKDFERLYIFVNAASNAAQNISLSCVYNLDGDNGNYPLQSYTLNTSASGYSVVKFQFPTAYPTTGHWINISCSNSGTNGPLKTYGMQLVWRPDSWE